MKAYLYTNNHMLFRFLARNLIAARGFIRDLPGTRPALALDDTLLFLTHKKLSLGYRETPNAGDLDIYPVAVEFEFDVEDNSEIVLISYHEGAYSCTLGSWKEYDSNRHIGAFIMGEAPFSAVKKIYFENKEDKKSFYRPSDDYWYPKKKFGVLPKGFTEELPLGIESALNAANACIPEKTGEIKRAVRKREKRRAAMLGLFYGSQDLKETGCPLYIDPVVQSFLMLDDNSVLDALPSWQFVLDGKLSDAETLTLIPAEKPINASLCVSERQRSIFEERTNPGVYNIGHDSVNTVGKPLFNQRLYNFLYLRFTDKPIEDEASPEYFKNIFDNWTDTAPELTAAERRAINVSLTEIFRLISGISNKSVDDIIAGVPANADVLKAFLFVAKDPSDREAFTRSLDAFEVPPKTCRRAHVLWNALNGLRGLLGEGYGKDNEALWQYIEALAYEYEMYGCAFNIEKHAAVIKEGEVFGAPIKCASPFEFDEIQSALALAPAECIDGAFYDALYAHIKRICPQKGDMAKYALHTASSDFIIRKGDEFENAEKLAADLLACLGALKPNRKNIHADYICNKEKLRPFYNEKPALCKTAAKAAKALKNNA